MNTMGDPIALTTFVTGQANAARQELLTELCSRYPGMSYTFIPGSPSGFKVKVGDAAALLLVGQQVEAFVAGFRIASGHAAGVLPETKQVAQHQFG